MRTPPASTLPGLLLPCLLAASLPAQTAPRPASPPVTPASAVAGEAAVVLSPFEVIAEEDGSYVATTTLAGTRFNTELKDVPASISVMTADFLRDIGANNLNDAMAYTIGAEQESPGQSGNNVHGSDLALNMRGFANSVLGRNYFESQTSQDSYNMERATFSRGPNSVLFGNGGAGGIADATTKRALPRRLSSFTVRAGGFDDYRFELDVNRPVSKSLAVRLNTLLWSKKSWRDFEHTDRRSAALAVTWQPFARTRLRFDGEYGKVDELKAQPWPALDGVTNWIAAGRPLSPTLGAAAAGTNAFTGTTRTFISNSREVLLLTGTRTTTNARAGADAGGATVLRDQAIVPFDRYILGPGATTDNDFLNAGIFLEQQLGPDLFLEAAANRQHIHRDWARAVQWNHGRIYADPNVRRPDGSLNPYAGEYYMENSVASSLDRRNQRWDDYRLTATYRRDLGRFGRHQIAGLVSRRDFVNRGRVYAEAWDNNPAQPNLTNAANVVTRRTYLSFDSTGRLPDHFPNPFTTPIAANGVTTRFYQSSQTDTLARFGSQVITLQSRFFSSRLVTTLGLRHDGQENWGSTLVRAPVTSEVLAATRNADSTSVAGNTRTAGVVYHALPWLSLAANTSTNATPQNFIAFGPDATNRNTPLGNRRGVGVDFGARFTLFGERVRGTVTYFSNNEENSQRFKSGNLTSGWELWLNQAALALGKPGAFASAGGEGGYYTGQDTVDVEATGWETEWVINVNRQLRLVLNGSTSESLGTNQWPRVTPIANELLTEMRAKPDLPVSGIGNATTLGAVVTLMERQLVTDHRTEGKPITSSRPDSGNLVVNYRFTDGALRGVAATLGVNARGRRVIGYHTVTFEPVWDGDYTQVNASLAYSRPLRFHGRKIDWNVTLNGTNILGHRHGLIPLMGDEIAIDRFSFEIAPTVYLTHRFTF
jgi:outer membrane receptor protein involved in Fe transport